MADLGGLPLRHLLQLIQKGLSQRSQLELILLDFPVKLANNPEELIGFGRDEVQSMHKLVIGMHSELFIIDLFDIRVYELNQIIIFEFKD